MSLTSAARAANSLEGLSLQCVKREQTLFAGVNFRLQAGQALQIIGANGTGKTSLLQIIAGLSVPESGQVRWQGKPLSSRWHEYRAGLRYMAHEWGFSHSLTPRANLRFCAELYALAADARSPRSLDVAEILSTLGLQAAADTPCGYLSRGQRQRLALGRLLTAPSRVWLLDEPSTALDQAGIDLLTNLLAQHLQRAGLVVFTSHQPLPLARGDILRLDLDAAATHRAGV